MSAPVILTVTRDFTAPPEAVFDAWLNPALARQFLFTTPNSETAVRPRLITTRRSMPMEIWPTRMAAPDISTAKAIRL